MTAIATASVPVATATMRVCFERVRLGHRRHDSSQRAIVRKPRGNEKSSALNCVSADTLFSSFMYFCLVSIISKCRKVDR